MPKRIPLEGRKFNKLYVKEYIGNGKYHCICDCKNECNVFGNNLISKHTTSCGCNKLTSNYAGKIFGFLQVIERADSKYVGGIKKVYWKCRCIKCERIVEVRADCLRNGYTSSCGCLVKDKDIPKQLKNEFVNGTQLSHVQSIPTKANKSGVVGVNWDKSRNKWQASIRFQGRKYNLGRFDDFDEACKVRKEAEETIFGNFLEWYEQNRN